MSFFLPLPFNEVESTFSSPARNPFASFKPRSFFPLPSFAFLAFDFDLPRTANIPESISSCFFCSSRFFVLFSDGTPCFAPVQEPSHPMTNQKDRKYARFKLYRSIPILCFLGSLIPILSSRLLSKLAAPCLLARCLAPSSCTSLAISRKLRKLVSSLLAGPCSASAWLVKAPDD